MPVSFKPAAAAVIGPKPTSALDEFQQAAMQFQDGVGIVIAGPGAGKSKTLTERYARLVSEGVSPDSILAVTFSKAAAADMCQRVAELTGYSEQDLSKWTCTIHSLGLKVVLASRGSLPFKLAANPIQPEQCKRLMRTVCRDFKCEYADARDFISLCKRRDIDPQQALEQSDTRGEYPPTVRAYIAYESEKHKQGWIDYEDMLFWAHRLLKTDAGVRHRWGRKFRYILS